MQFALPRKRLGIERAQLSGEGDFPRTSGVDRKTGNPVGAEVIREVDAYKVVVHHDAFRSSRVLQGAY